MKGHEITMLGTGLIGDFYTGTLHGQRGRDRVRVVYSRSEDRAAAFRDRWAIPESTTDLEAAVNHPETDVVVVGLPNFLHEEAVGLAAKAGKAVLCTKPLGRTADEARRMLETVEKAGVFAGYLEDLCYTPKTLKAVASVRAGAIGDVTWVRSRETHPGPHSAWFWDGRLTGGGAIIDLGCHCIEIIRNFVGKSNRPVEVMCHTDTLVHPISDEDNAIALIRFESAAIGQFEVSWTFRGGMDLRDEVAGTHGTIWMNHFLRTGFEMFTAGGGEGYVAEKAETSAGWLFPVGDEASELGYVDMFSDMFRSLEAGTAPMETFYDGYVVNAIMDACYRSATSRAWEPVELLEWRGGSTARISSTPETYEDRVVIKREILPDGRQKLILKDPATGDFVDRVVAGE
ncbi:MAG TPA: Gfo/Idh/MocA family oxidoreductase [Candidatus Limnocylindrales bacterium]|nr:Gfo/Idh/MocA family oxidoreductase [Candidatus Limnocylindrales bacterium]